MDMQESARLRKEYAGLFDEQLIELALQGADQFREGVYGLIMAEIRHRGIEEKVISAQNGVNKDEVKQETDEGNISDELVPFIILLKEDDAASIVSILDGADIKYCSDPLHLKGKEYPRLFMIPRGKIDEATGLLNSINVNASVLLWK